MSYTEFGGTTHTRTILDSTSLSAGTYTSEEFKFSGGRYSNMTGTYTFTDCKFTSTKASTKGSLLLAKENTDNVKYIFKNCLFEGLDASGDNFIYLQGFSGHEVTFEDCKFINVNYTGTASKTAFIYYEKEGTLSITFKNSDLSGITSSGSTLGLYDSPSGAVTTISITNSTLPQNELLKVPNSSSTITLYGDNIIRGSVDVNTLTFSADSALRFENNNEITITGTISGKMKFEFAGQQTVNFASLQTVTSNDQVSISSPLEGIVGNSRTIATNLNGINTSGKIMYGNEEVNIGSGSPVTYTSNTLSAAINFKLMAEGNATDVAFVDDYDESSIGTVNLTSAKNINGQTGGNTTLPELSGVTLYTNNNNLSLSNLTYAGKIYGGAGTLSLENVTMNNTCRIYGGGTTSQTGDINVTVTNCAIAGQIYAGGDNATTDTTQVENINLTINGNTAKFSNIFAGANVTGTNTVFNAGNITTTITGGNFGKVTGNGSWTSGGATVQQASSLSISGGTFDTFVYAGAYCDGNDATVASTSLTISGGTFKGYVLGGCLGKTTADANRATVTGDIAVTISGGSFHKDLIVGNKGQGTIGGNTSLTFIGTGVTFDSTCYISGVNAKYSANDKSTWFGVSGSGDHTSTLTFDGYTGAIDASINESFTRVVVENDSAVALNGAKTRLSQVSTWNLEVGSSNISGTALLDFNGADLACDFANDTINLTFDEGASLTSGNHVTLMDFGTNSSTGLMDATSVTLGAQNAVIKGSCWESTNYTLSYGTDNKSLILAAK